MKSLFAHLFLLSVFVIGLLISALCYADTPEVRVIHFIPSDIENVKSDTFLQNAVKSVQIYFRDQLEYHEYEPKTFKVEAKIISVKARSPLDFYQLTWSRSNPKNDSSHEALKIHSLILNELFDKRITRNDPLGAINLIFLAGAENIVYHPKAPLGAVNATDGRNHHNIVPANSSAIEIAIAHEMGHSFNLVHNTITNYLMSHSRTEWTLNKLSLLPREARLISQSRYIHYTLPTTTTDFVVDVNFDSKVDLDDVQTIRKAINGEETGYDTDINNDGVTDEADINIVKIAAMKAIIAASPAKRKIRISTWGQIKRR